MSHIQNEHLEQDAEEHGYDKGYHTGHLEGYKQGFKEGREYQLALEKNLEEEKPDIADFISPDEISEKSEQLKERE